MPKRVRPIRPSEVAKEKSKAIPGVVFEVFNQLIAENFSNRHAIIKMEDIVNRLELKGLDRKEMYSKGWLDVEGVYREAGWKVVYDQPAYNESYPATFEFSS
jgi:hypothetical protein